MSKQLEQIDGMIEDKIATESVIARIEGDIINDVISQGGVIAASVARNKAEKIAKKLNVDGVTKKNHRTPMEAWRKMVEKEPALVGLRAGGEADGLDRALVTSWLRDGNMTAFSRLAASNPMVKLHAVARQHGKRDAFDRASPYVAIGGVKPGEPVVTNVGHLSREQIDTAYRFFTKQGWNKSQQAQLFATDRKRFDRLAAAAEVSLGSTRPKK